ARRGWPPAPGWRRGTSGWRAPPASTDRPSTTSGRGCWYRCGRRRSRQHQIGLARIGAAGDGARQALDRTTEGFAALLEIGELVERRGGRRQQHDRVGPPLL